MTTIRFPSKRSGGRRLNSAMTKCSDFISEIGLIDLPLPGGRCTWPNNYSWSGIDCFLVSPEWEKIYSGMFQKRMLRLCLDHFPFSLDYGCLKGARDLSSLRTCCLKLKGLWVG
jgi:hypothetical protein